MSLQNYVVTNVLKGIGPDCPFSDKPTGDDFEEQTFSHYYMEKYDIEVKQPIQPILVARPISNNLKCVRPK